MLPFFWIAIVTAHVLAANIAATVPLYAAWIDWRATKAGTLSANQFAGGLVLKSLWAFLMAAALAAVMMAIPIHPSGATPWSVLSRLPVGVLANALGELGFHVVLMGLAIWLWRRPDASKLARITRRLLVLLAATNLVYHFPLFFTALATLAHSGDTWPAEIDSATWKKIRFSGDVVPMALHHWVAAVAAGGVAVIRWSACLNDGNATSFRRMAAMPALLATLLQIPVGIYLLTSLPMSRQELVMGRSPLASGLFLFGILAAAYLMHQLFKSARQEFELRDAKLLAISYTIVTAIMFATQFCVRTLV